MSIKNRISEILFTPERELKGVSKIVLAIVSLIITLIFYYMAGHELSFFGLNDAFVKLAVVLVGIPVIFLKGIFVISILEKK